MENDKNKPFTVTPDNFAEASIQLTPSTHYYKLNTDKIKTIKDIKLVLKHMNLSYCPANSEAFEEMKHLLIID